MPPDTLWQENATYLQGSVTYDDPGTTYDMAIPYDAPQANLVSVFTPSDTLWQQGTV